MYYEYWNLNKPPFDNVPDPSMYVDCHVSMEKVISETIFAIKEGNECFAVIIGDMGLGKTLSLRIIIDSLEPQKYKIALITNPSISFSQLLREIIGQITGQLCEEKPKFDLLEIFNHILVQMSAQGIKIVIFIDEANAISPANLENLRLLTNMQDDKRNLFTLVLAGQIELAQRLEHPKRANLFQRIGAYGRIDKLPSAEAVKTYIEARLKMAGALRNIFSEDCIPIIWEASDHGIPRLINNICKLCLKTGETNELRTISADVATQIAERFQKLSKVALQKRIPRIRSEKKLTPDEISMLEEIEGSVDITGTITEQEVIPEISLVEDKAVPEAVLTARPPKIDVAAQAAITHLKSVQEKVISKTYNKIIKRTEEEEIFEEVIIDSYKIKLAIPKYIIEQGASSDHEIANALAGYWAAQIIKNNKHLTSSSKIDPVTVWNDIKNVILKKMKYTIER